MIDEEAGGSAGANPAASADPAPSGHATYLDTVALGRIEVDEEGLLPVPWRSAD